MFTDKHYTRQVKRLTTKNQDQEPGVCDLKKNTTSIGEASHLGTNNIG